ncbi:MAG: hypothetical protein Q8O37_01320 [Sulfuricellaceae bacterium]|nr:hypothetical protein [Sulfuricellaceae bacterium]
MQTIANSTCNLTLMEIQMMNFCTSSRTATALLTAALAGLTPITSQAQTTGDQWQWDMSIYGWLPGISGMTSLPSGSGPNIDVSADQVIDSLKMAFMGNISAKKGKWGLATDVVYSDFSGSQQGSRDLTIGQQGLPANVSADLSLDIKTMVWSMGGTYELGKTQGYTADLVFGARMLDVKQTLDWSFNGDIAGLPLPGRSGSGEVNAKNWDAIIGVRGAVNLGSENKWFIPYYLDAGTGDSDLTLQANVGIGYRYKWGALVATWRYLDYEMPSDAPIQSMTLSGPLVGATFHW